MLDCLSLISLLEYNWFFYFEILSGFGFQSTFINLITMQRKKWLALIKLLSVLTTSIKLFILIGLLCCVSLQRDAIHCKWHLLNFIFYIILMCKVHHSVKLILAFTLVTILIHTSRPQLTWCLPKVSNCLVY